MTQEKILFADCYATHVLHHEHSGLRVKLWPTEVIETSCKTIRGQRPEKSIIISYSKASSKIMPGSHRANAIRIELHELQNSYIHFIRPNFHQAITISLGHLKTLYVVSCQDIHNAVHEWQSAKRIFFVESNQLVSRWHKYSRN